MLNFGHCSLWYEFYCVEYFCLFYPLWKSTLAKRTNGANMRESHVCIATHYVPLFNIADLQQLSGFPGDIQEEKLLFLDYKQGKKYGY